MSLSNRHQNTITVIRSLRIQRPNVLRDAPVISGENGASITCMHCSYVLHGQNTLNCPECGLWLASCYRDPTPWGETFNEKDADDPIAFGGFNAFWLTVFSIVRFDRRIRLRTAMFPCTRGSRRFAVTCAVIAAFQFGILAAVSGVGYVNQQGLAPPLFLAGAFMLGFVGGAAVVVGALMALQFVCMGRWKKRRYRFVPSSVQYSIAWALPVSALAIVGSVLAMIFNLPPEWGSVPLVALGAIFWLLWLWDGVSQASARLNVLPRLASVLFLCLVGWSFVGRLRMIDSSRTRPANSAQQSNPLLATVDWGSTAMQNLATKVTQPSPRASRTHVLIIDQIVDENAELPETTLKELCPDLEDSFVVIRGKECTMDRIRKRFRELPLWIAEADRFILYINGHGMKKGGGYIAMENGWISGQMISDLLAQIATPDSLVIVDSCYSGNFVRSLKDSDCVVVASSDRYNVSFTTGMNQLWKSWRTIKADVDADGCVDIEEAFWHSIEDIVAVNARMRERWLKSSVSPAMRRLLVEESLTSPQFNEYGKADVKKFSMCYR